MFTVYILQSEKTFRYYTGTTHDIVNRLAEHNAGENKSTRSGIPWRLVYREQCMTKAEAFGKERQIKSRGAGRYLQDIRQFVSD